MLAAEKPEPARAAVLAACDKKRRRPSDIENLDPMENIV
jgi:hypothetical protein